MASKFQTHSRRYRSVVRRHLTVLYVIVIMLITMAPGYGGGGSDSGGGGGGCGSSGSTGTGGPPPNVAIEAYEDYSSAAIVLPIGTFSETIHGDSYIAQLLGDASNRFDPRLPGYSYFQGVIQANNHITIAGQVRVVGGILGADQADATASLYNGAMVTTNAHAFVGAGPALKDGPPGMRTRIKHWEEIPTP